MIHVYNLVCSVSIPLFCGQCSCYAWRSLMWFKVLMSLDQTVSGILFWIRLSVCYLQISTCPVAFWSKQSTVFIVWYNTLFIGSNTLRWQPCCPPYDLDHVNTDLDLQCDIHRSYRCQKKTQIYSSLCCWGFVYIMNECIYVRFVCQRKVSVRVQK